MNETPSRHVGAITTLTKDISDADLALFVLVMGDGQLSADEPPAPDQQERQAAPDALLAALLTATVARHVEQPKLAHFISETIRFVQPAYTDDQLTATAEITEYDAAAHTLRVSAHCENQAGSRLAEGEFQLSEV